MITSEQYSNLHPYGLATFSFKGEIGELSFEEGEVIELTRYIDEEWMEGRKGGINGLVPISYIQVIIPPEDGGNEIDMGTTNIDQSIGIAHILHDFNGESTDELSLKEGSQIKMSPYWVELECQSDLPYHIEDAIDRVLTALPSTRTRHRTRTRVASSALQEWCASPLVATNVEVDKSLDARLSDFPIYKELDEIVKTLHTTDVVCLIAPTGSGKSILSPFIAEKLAQCSDRGMNSRAYRKTLLVVPNVEHCSSTARTFGKLFGSSKIALSAFLNPYEEKVPREGGYLSNKTDFSNDEPAEFAICTYNSATRALPDDNCCLNLLILDEVHEPNDNVQVTIAMALKKMLAEPFERPKYPQMTSHTVNKLLLMTATLDDKKREIYEKYFTSQGLSFKILDLTDKLQRMKQITMSCFPGENLPPMFVVTTNSDRLFREISMLGIADASMDLNALHDRVSVTLNFVMGLACENLQAQLDCMGSTKRVADMQSIIVILPGTDQVDRMYAATFKLSNFKFNGFPGFHPVRLTPLVKDDMSITSECGLTGSWQKEGHLGRIVITTNLVAAGLTVPNAAYVIDSGMQGVLSEYTKDGLNKLETTFIDKQMIIQRAGRTGRTTDGEYFLPYSTEKVNEMMKLDHGELLLHRTFDERLALYNEVYNLRLPQKLPFRLREELLDSMKIRGLYHSGCGFAYGNSIHMNNLFNFLSPEQARIVILGTRMGIAAHVIYLVADSISRVKFCLVGSVESGTLYGGPSMKKSATHLFGEAMDKYGNDSGKWPDLYRGVGDSIVLADLLVGFFSVVPCKFDRSVINQIEVPSCNFWSGNIIREGGWAPSLAEMYTSFVSEEGRYSVSRYVSQIESCLHSAGILPPATGGRAIFEQRHNRHLVSTDNFCLNENGRALLAALLTMHSSRVCELMQEGYRICREKPNGTQLESLFPESIYSRPTQRKDKEIIYGRYTEMFERRGEYCGMIDPITLKQMAFFLNISGNVIICEDEVRFTLNASNAKRGIFLKMNSDCTVKRSRDAVERCLERITGRDQWGLEKFIINLWRECGQKNHIESRCMELIVDEMAEGEQKSITLGGGSGVNVSVLNLEDCTKCDCLKGAFSCPNRACLEMTNCRHMVCFDCIEERIALAVQTRERPNCPIAMCSNLLTRGEVSKLMWRSPKMIEMCRSISNLFPDKDELEEPGKDDLLVTSSIYGHYSTIKAIVIPMHALVGDMVTACLQQQRMIKNRMTSSLGIFIRTPITKGRAVYDQVDLKELSKAQVKDQGWPQKLQLVIDVDERLKKAHKSKNWKS